MFPGRSCQGKMAAQPGERQTTARAGSRRLRPPGQHVPAPRPAPPAGRRALSGVPAGRGECGGGKAAGGASLSPVRAGASSPAAVGLRGRCRPGLPCGAARAAEGGRASELGESSALREEGGWGRRWGGLCPPSRGWRL